MAKKTTVKTEAKKAIQEPVKYDPNNPQILRAAQNRQAQARNALKK